MDAESIRVKGLGHCQILEVSHGLATSVQKMDNTLAAELKEKIAALERQQREKNQESAIIAAQKKFIQAFVDKTVKAPSKKTEQSTERPYDINNSLLVMDFYATEFARLDDAQLVVDEALADLRAKIKSLRSDLEQVSASNLMLSAGSSQRSRCITITVDVNNCSGNVDLQFSYVVSDATWTPSYDIRVATADNQMTISYFAEITQRSGEDWKECDMFLSTSNPAIGSSPPPLDTKTEDSIQKKQLQFRFEDRRKFEA